MNKKHIQAAWEEVIKQAGPEMTPEMRAGTRDFFFYGADSLYRLFVRNICGINGKKKMTPKEGDAFLTALLDEIEDFYNEETEDSLAAANDKSH